MGMFAALIGGLIAIGGQTSIGEDSLRISKGTCGTESHIASGADGSDLTKQQTPFRCTGMVTSMVDGQPGHFMFQFVGPTGGPIGFAGFAVEPNIFRIDRLYLTPGRATPVAEGECKTFMTKGQLTGVFCGGYFVRSGRRTVAVISFTPSPQ